MPDASMGYWDLLVFGVISLVAVGEAVWAWLTHGHSK
jgi:hypothetical protein